MRVHTHTCTHTPTHHPHTRTRTHACTHTHVLIYSNICTHLNAYTHAHMHPHMYTYLSKHSHTLACTHTHRTTNITKLRVGISGRTGPRCSGLFIKSLCPSRRSNFTHFEFIHRQMLPLVATPESPVEEKNPEVSSH